MPKREVANEGSKRAKTGKEALRKYEERQAEEEEQEPTESESEENDDNWLKKR